MAIMEPDPSVIGAVFAVFDSGKALFIARLLKRHGPALNKPPLQTGNRQIAQGDHLGIIGVGRAASGAPFRVPNQRTRREPRPHDERARHAAAGAHAALNRKRIRAGVFLGKGFGEGRNPKLHRRAQKEIANRKRTERAKADCPTRNCRYRS